MTKSFWHLLVLSSLIFFAAPLTSKAGPPTDQIKGTVDNAVGLLKDSRNTSAAAKDRREQLRQILFTRFEFS
jgi:hypothetical protein